MGDGWLGVPNMVHVAQCDERNKTNAQDGGIHGY